MVAILSMVIAQAAGGGDRGRATPCHTDTNISHGEEHFKQSLRNNQRFFYVISEHS